MIFYTVIVLFISTHVIMGCGLWLEDRLSYVVVHWFILCCCSL